MISEQWIESFMEGIGVAWFELLPHFLTGKTKKTSVGLNLAAIKWEDVYLSTIARFGTPALYRWNGYEYCEVTRWLAGQRGVCFTDKRKEATDCA
jgi:hypothetical protein